jgi:hypothetical protein
VINAFEQGREVEYWSFKFLHHSASHLFPGSLQLLIEQERIQYRIEQDGKGDDAGIF